MRTARRTALIGAAALFSSVGVDFSVVRTAWLQSGLPRLVLIGDSTVADHSPLGSVLTGWGQVLAIQLAGRYQVLNHARSGSSAARFLRESWPIVQTRLRRDDLLLMQFGHVEAPPDSPQHSSPEGAYRAALGQFVQQALGCGVKPVICTPVASHRFVDGHWVYALAAYAEAAAELALGQSVPLLDLGRHMGASLEQMGEQAARAWFMISVDGRDGQHLSRTGATATAAIVASELEQQGLLSLPHIAQQAKSKTRG